MEIQASGKVIVADVQKGVSSTGREWQKKVFVIDFLEGTTGKKLAFELFGEDNIKNNPFRVGQNVTVFFDIDSKEWNGRWFTTLKALRVAKINGDKNGESNQTELNPEMTPLSKDEELPF